MCRRHTVIKHLVPRQTGSKTTGLTWDDDDNVFLAQRQYILTYPKWCGALKHTSRAKSTFDISSEHLWWLNGPHIWGEAERQFIPTACLKLMSVSGRRRDPPQTDGTHKRGFITPLGRRGQSANTCVAASRPCQVHGSLFPFSAWLNFESTSLHVNTHRKLH